MFDTNCLKHANAYFEAAKSGRGNSLGGGLLSVLPDRLEANMEIDKINLKFELMHPETSAAIHNSGGFFYPRRDIPAMLPQHALERFINNIKHELDELTVKYECKVETLATPRAFKSESEPRKSAVTTTHVIFSCNIQDAEKIASVLDNASFLAGKNVKMASDVRAAVEMINAHNQNRTIPTPTL